MKRNLSIIVTLFVIAGCKKSNQEILQTSTPSSDTSFINAKNGSGGSGGSTGLISSIGGAFRLIGGNSDSIQVNFSQPAPASGWALSLRSSDPSIQLPSTVVAPAGAFIIHPALTSSVIPASKNVTITATLGTESKSFVLKVFPLHYRAFAAPKLQSPGNGAGFKSRIQVKFTWTDDVNAYYHDLQISADPTFSSTTMDEVYLNDPIWAQSYFNGLGKRYWRVRYIDASGAPGPWSQANWFEIKQ